MTTRRIYFVDGPITPRLVDAYSKAQAISHCAKSEYSAEVATQRSLIRLLKAGIKVETAGATEPEKADS